MAGLLGEMNIKVSAPFVGIADLGFTAQYREQENYSQLRDVPLLIEGPSKPLALLGGFLHSLREMHMDAYMWSDAVMLSDEVMVMAFKDRTQGEKDREEGERNWSGYVFNLVKPVVFTFLHDCAVAAELKLAEVIEMQVSTSEVRKWNLVMARSEIVAVNGKKLLWQLAG